MINTYIITEINIPDYGDRHIPQKMQLTQASAWVVLVANSGVLPEMCRTECRNIPRTVTFRRYAT